ncbi:MAG: HEAT repeat domain-containing protein [bacterium]|nr:HEAT repeat domain-containing protein [bacterium]
MHRIQRSLVVLAVCLTTTLPAAAQNLSQLNDQTKQKYATVLQNKQAPANLMFLHAQLADRNSAVRIQAVQSLALIGSPMGALLLARAMDDSLERDPAVRIEAAIGLGDIGGRQALETLGLGLDDKSSTVRKRVIESLRWAGTVFAVPYIQEVLRNDRSADNRLEAVRQLRKIGTQFSIQPLVEALMSDKDVGIRLTAADALGEVGKKEIQAARYLGEAYRLEKNSGVRLEIVGSMGLVRNQAGIPYLQEAMQDRDLAVRLRATQVYGRVLGLQ